MAQAARAPRLLSLCLGAALFWAAPLQAQEALEPEIEALIGPSQQPGTGLTLARSQVQNNDLLGAAGTLERVLLVQPDATPARLLYASLLCRLDDAAGARVELSLLQGQDVDDAAWAEVASACGGAVTRPHAGGSPQ